MITAKQRHQLLLADRTRDATWITAAVEHLLATDPTVTLLDIELALRDGGAYSYLIACQGKMVQVVFGMKDWLAALKAAGLSPDANRSALADRAVTAQCIAGSLL